MTLNAQETTVTKARQQIAFSNLQQIVAKLKGKH